MKHEEVFKRRLQVTSLLTQGFSPAEMANLLEVDVNTIYNDMRVIRSGRNPELALQSVNEIFAQALLNYRARIRQLHNILRLNSSGTVQIKVLSELRLLETVLLKYSNQFAKAVKCIEDTEELRPDEAQLLGSISARLMYKGIEQPRVSRTEMRRLVHMIKRLKKCANFTNRPGRPEQVRENPEPGTLTQGAD